MAISVKEQFKAVTSARRLALREAHKQGKAVFYKVFSDSKFLVGNKVCYHNWFSLPTNRPVSSKVFMYLEDKLESSLEKAALWDAYCPRPTYK